MTKHLQRLSLVVTLLLALSAAARAVDSPPTEQRITVAVLPFGSSTPKSPHAPLAEAITDLLMNRLETVDGLVLVDRSAIDKVLKEHKFKLMTSQDDQIRLGRIVGAQYVLAGSVTPVDDKFQVSVQLLDVSTARVARSAKVTACGDRLMVPLDKLVRELLKQWNRQLPELTAEQIDKSPEASLHFIRGLGYYYAKLPDDAIVEFMKVLSINPKHARARFWNGMAYCDLGEYEHAKLEFARFLKQYSQHDLAPRAKILLEKCETQTRKPRQGESP